MANDYQYFNEEELKGLLQSQTRNLYKLMIDAAEYGPDSAVPLSIKNQIESIKNNISIINKEIETRQYTQNNINSLQNRINLLESELKNTSLLVKMIDDDIGYMYNAFISLHHYAGQGSMTSNTKERLYFDNIINIIKEIHSKYRENTHCKLHDKRIYRIYDGIVSINDCFLCKKKEHDL